MNHSNPLSPEASVLLSEIKAAVEQAPRALRPFRFYDLRPVVLQNLDAASTPTSYSLDGISRNVTTFDAKGLAQVSVPAAAHLYGISPFCVPQSDEKERVDAFKSAPDDLSRFIDEINEQRTFGLILHEGLPSGSLAIWPDDLLGLLETGYIERQGATNFRLTAKGRQTSTPLASQEQPKRKEETTVSEAKPPKPRVLLSHSTKDNAFVRRLADDLNQADLDVWVDWLELKVGDSIVNEINERFKSTDYLIVVLSPNAVESNWVKAELGAALMTQFANQSLTVLPVLYQEAVIPALLRDRVYADFTGDYSQGLKQLLQTFERDLSLVEPIINQAATEKSAQGRCLQKLAGLREKDVRELLSQRSTFDDVNELWRDTVGGRMGDEIPGQSLRASILELFSRAEKAQKAGELLGHICELFSDLPESSFNRNP